MQVFVPVSHYKDTYYFDKTNNYFKKVKGKGDQTPGLLCPKLSELLYFLYPAYPISIKITVIMMPMQSQMRS